MCAAHCAVLGAVDSAQCGHVPRLAGSVEEEPGGGQQFSGAGPGFGQRRSSKGRTPKRCVSVFNLETGVLLAKITNTFHAFVADRG